MAVLERIPPRAYRVRPAATPPASPSRSEAEPRPSVAWGFATAIGLLGVAFGLVFARGLHVSHAPAIEVCAAIFLAAGGVAVVPLTMLRATPADGLGSTLGLPSVALLSATAAMVHFAAVDMQGGGYLPFTLAFAALAVFQLAWTLLVLMRPSRRLLASGAFVNLATVAIWVWSRTTGLPFGPDPGKPESVAFADVTATALESGLVLMAGWLMARPLPRGHGRRAAANALILGLVLIPPTTLAMIGAAGTHLLASPSV